MSYINENGIPRRRKTVFEEIMVEKSEIGKSPSCRRLKH
jgi:hypothetical protein